MSGLGGTGRGRGPSAYAPAALSLAAIVTLGLVAALAVAQPLPMPPIPFGRVHEVIIQGTDRVQPAAVRRLVGTYPGDVLDPAQLRLDLLAIRGLRSGASSVFEDVRVEVERVGAELRVLYVVVERPRLDDVVLHFTDDAPLEDEAREAFVVQPGELYDLVRVRAAERAVEARYRQGGYPLARVRATLVTRTVPDPSGATDGMPAGARRNEWVELSVLVEPGPELEVRRITFTGNAAFDDEALLEAMVTRPAELIATLTQRDRYDPELLADDRRRLLLLYHDRGFPDAVVAEPAVEITPGEGAVYIAFFLVEGERFRVGSVGIEGDRSASEAWLLAEHVRVASGDWLSASAAEADRARLLAAYREAGHARATVRLESERETDAPRLHLVYVIDAGPECWVGVIRIAGNTLTRDAVIRRQIQLLESDRFDGAALVESRTRLLRLGLFESVTIREVATERADVIDLEVVVVERDVLLPAASLGIGSDGTLSVKGQLATANFFGHGQTVAALVELGTLRTGFSLGVTDPDVQASGWLLGGRLFWEDVRFPEFGRRSVGGGLTTGHRLGDDWRISGGYVLEDVRLEAAGGPAAGQALGQIFSAGRTARLLAALEWDTRDSARTPRTGFVQQLSTSWAGAPLGSAVDFVRLELASRWYALLGPVALRLNLELGYLVSTEPARRVPIGERFFLGGADSVRGFEPYALAPTEPVPSEPGAPGSGTDDFAIGGNKYLLGNLELGFPLVPALGLAGVVFVDVGNAFDEDEDYTFGLDVLADERASGARRLRTSAGLGLRWTLFGDVPFRFEWGFPLRPMNDEDAMVFSLGAGLAF